MYCKKRFMLFTMLFLLVGALLPSFVSNAVDVERANAAPANQTSAGDKVKRKVTHKNDNFQVETEYGIDGYVAWDSPLVVKVIVTSDENFEGVLKVEPEREAYNENGYAYGEDITLAAGEAKTFTFTVSDLDALGKVSVSVLNEKEKVLYSETDTISAESASTYLTIGVLSDDYSALNYFDGLPLQLGGSSFISSTLELTKDSLVPDSFALSVLQYIMIDNFDTANLSDAQYKALKEWVNNGGVLVLSLGANSQNVLHKFTDDFISGSLGDMEKKEIEWNILSTFEAADEEALETAESDNENVSGNNLSLAGVDSVDFKVEAAEELAAFSKNQTAYKKDIGSGSVVVLSYALGMEPMVSYNANKEVAELLLFSTMTPEIYNRINGGYYGNDDMSYCLDLAGYANNTKKPSALLYGLLLTVYLVFAGPLLYLILKKMKKRERIWIAIPVTAILFTGVIYLTGFLYRVRTPLANTLTVVELDDNRKQEKVYTSLVCPKAKRYEIDILNGYSNLKPDLYTYDYSFFGTADKGSTCMLKNHDDGIEMILDCQSAFDETRFMVSKTSDNEVGTIDYDLHCYTDGFEGTITNHTKMDLKEVIINFENYFYRIEELKKGETIAIDKKKLFSQSGYGNTLDNLYMNEIDDYYSNEYFNMLSRIYSAMEMVYVDSSSFGQGKIWAFAEDYAPDMMDRTKVKQSGLGVLMESFSAEYEDVTGVYYPSLEPMIVSGDYGFDEDSGYMYDREVEVTYSFADYPEVTALVLSTFGKKEVENGYGEYYPDIFAFNVESGAFEQIFTEDAELSGDEFKKYVNGNSLILKYSSVGEYEPNYIPRIIAKGDE